MTDANAMPPELVAGDTLRYVRATPDYSPNDGWAFKVALVKPGTAPITIDGADNGDGRHLVQVAAGDTVEWEPGVYYWQESVEKAGERHTLSSGALQLIASFESQANGYDARTVWQQTLDELEAAYKNMAAGNIQTASVSFNGYVTQYRNIDDLITAINHARKQVAREKQEQALRNGSPLGNRIQFRF